MKKNKHKKQKDHNKHHHHTPSAQNKPSRKSKVERKATDLTIYQVGERFDSEKGSWEEGMSYSYHGGMHQLLIVFQRIQPSERAALHQGMCWFGLHVEEGVIFLLFRIVGPGTSGIRWHDIPYCWHLVPEQARTLPPDPLIVPPGLGAMLTIFLIEASTGVIEAIRPLNWSHHFTKEMYQAIHTQAATPFCGKEEYTRRITRIYHSLPSPERMAEVASAKCVGGMYEGPLPRR